MILIFCRTIISDEFIDFYVTDFDIVVLTEMYEDVSDAMNVEYILTKDAGSGGRNGWGGAQH